MTEFGFQAERISAEYLTSKGYKIIDHNYRKPWGEIDIIVEKEGVVIFVEVKANAREIAGFEPELRVNVDKRYRMARIAATYLSDRGFGEDQPWQLDIVSVTLVREREVVKIRHFKNIE